MKIYFWKLFNELHDQIKNHPLVIYSLNVKYSSFVKINGAILNKEASTSNISMGSTQQYGTFNSPLSFSCARTVYGKIFIGYKSLRKYMPKYIKPMSNRYIITCGCEICISSMLLKYDINKCRVS